jgi:peptide deformylase
MPRLLQIAQLGHQVLRDEAKAVKDLNDPALQSLFEDMLATMEDADGVGIAAPQVYVSQRCFIFSSRQGSRQEDTPLIGPTVAVNPEILWVSPTKANGWEACLSIPGIRGIVPRHESIKVHYSTLSNSSVEGDLSGFAARVFQHEYDHLYGLVYLDRIKSTKDIITEKEYQRLMK